MAYSLRSFRASDLYTLNLTNLDPLTENYDIRFYMQYLATWPSLFICAIDPSDNIIGYIMGKIEEDPLTHSFSPHYLPWHGHITALTVAPHYRRCGVARKLCLALERECNAQNAWFLDLFVRASNDTAINIYRGIGYSIYRRVVDYYNDDPTGRGPGEDAFDMRKSLKRDKDGKHVRKNGENFHVMPEDVYR
ncbi:hypothetical protein MMC25_008105 [Agyrium rufum]|nr:hypothetical protein [Agyrium rufum]